jgi:hypothetical protein
MMAFAKRDEPEQVLVRMIPGVRLASRPGDPRTESPPQAAAVQEYVTFYESRRSGNVGIAVTPAAAPAHEEMAAAERILAAHSFGVSPEDRAERLGPEPRTAAASTAPRSEPCHGGTPATATTRDFGVCSAPEPIPSEDEIIGHIMACDCQRPAVAAALSLPTVAMHRPQVDPQLSRIVDAWAGLPPTTREAVVELVNPRPYAARRAPVGARTVSVPRRKPARAKDPAVAESPGTGRRRTRKAADPPQ